MSRPRGMADGAVMRSHRSFAAGRQVRSNEARPPWWLHPAALCAAFTLPVYLLLFQRLLEASGNPTLRLQYSAPIYVEQADIAFTLIAIAAMCMGALLGSGIVRHGPAGTPAADVDVRGLDLLFWVALLAYAYWFGPVIIGNPVFFLKALQGDATAVSSFRDAVGTTPGVTTLTQFGLAYVSIYMIVRGAGNAGVRRRHFFFAAAILLLAGVRALVWSERIALFELMAVMAVAACRYSPPRARAWRIPIVIGPYLAAMALPVFFIAFEMRRSWATTYSRIYDSVVQFGLDRLDIYYVSALNNGAGFLHAQGPNFAGHFTLEWLYRMPLLSNLMKMLGPNTSQPDYGFFLQRSADIEFNNIAGVFVAFLDWGYVGGIAWLFAMGLLLGLTYRRFMQGAGLLQYLYPLGIYFLFELARIYYLGGSRVFVAVLGCVLFQAVARKGAPAPAVPHLRHPR